MSTAKPMLGNRRVTGKEQYYTPADVARDVVQGLVDVAGPLASRHFIEPAGGVGTFIDSAQAVGARSVSSWDIEPLHRAVKRGNFLDQVLPAGDAVVASNPPFGRNNALAIPFFNHLADAAEVIAFIVPRSWRKWSVINRLDPRFHLVRDDDLTINYVDVQGRPISKKNLLRTCVQYWKRESHLRPRYEVEDVGLIERSNPREADVSMTVFGYGCGRIRTEFERVPNTTQMFLKINDKRALDVLTTADFNRFSMNTAYTQALSFPEVNFIVNLGVLGDSMFREVPVVRRTA